MFEYVHNGMEPGNKNRGNLFYYDVGQLFRYYYKSTYVSYTNSRVSKQFASSDVSGERRLTRKVNMHLSGDICRYVFQPHRLNFSQSSFLLPFYALSEHLSPARRWSMCTHNGEERQTQLNSNSSLNGDKKRLPRRYRTGIVIEWFRGAHDSECVWWSRLFMALRKSKTLFNCFIWRFCVSVDGIEHGEQNELRRPSSACRTHKSLLPL